MDGTAVPPGPFAGEEGLKKGRDAKRSTKAGMPVGGWAALALLLAFAAAVAISLIFEGPRHLYAKAVYICLDCIGLI